MQIFIFILYIPLILKTVFSVSRLEKVFPFFPELIGKIEYYFSPIRDFLLSICLAFIGIYQVCFLSNFFYGFLFLGFFFLSQINWYHRKKFRLDLCRWVLKFGEIEPNFFFKIYYRGLGSFLNPLFISPPTIDYSSLDYRTGKTPRKSYLPLLRNMVDTLTLAKLAILAMKKLPSKEGIDAFDLFARLWGSRFVARTHLKLSTQGIEKIPPLQGKVLLVFNHKSYLDFALTFFALGEIRNGSRHLRPRFIAAKDHFIDNPILYSWIGIGKCIEKAGMIFINRQKGKGWLAMQQASQKLIEEELEVAVYPQGTRASAMVDEKGVRRDAGYYNTFNQKSFQDPHGHLKIGSAQLILDTALALREKKADPLQVLFIGIEGTANVGPKKSFLIQTESEVRFKIGKCWKVELPENISIENPQGKIPQNDSQRKYLEILNQFQATIDNELEQTTKWNEILMERFLKEVGGNKAVEKFLIASNQNHHNLPFMILDRIYTLPIGQRSKPFQEYEKLVLENAGHERWIKFNQEISLKLLSLR